MGADVDIHVVDRTNRHLYAELLDENFRLRAEIFIDELGWKALRASNGRERDQFDTDDATYYFAVENGRLVGSIRRHCSLAPTLLSDVFSHLAPHGFRREAEVYESTRQYIIRAYREEHPCRVAGYLQRALWAHSFEQGGTAINFVTWAWYVPLLTRSGLRPKPLGLPTRHDDMDLIAVTCPTNTDVLDALTAFYDLEPTPFLREGLTAPARVAEAA